MVEKTTNDSLNFVKGAVSAKDLIPVLTHFHFYEGRVQGGNGKVTMDAPADIGIDCTVPAIKFLKALNTCSDNEPVEVALTDSGKVRVKQKGFRALLPVAPHEDFPRIIIDTEVIGVKRALPSGFLSMLKVIAPFIGDDATRPWSCGAFITQTHLYATNNISLVRAPYNWPTEHRHLIIPLYAVNELLRIGRDPDHFIVEETAITFFYGDRWLRTNLLGNQWPDIERMFDCHNDFQGDTASKPLIEVVEKLIAFCPDEKQPVIHFDAEANCIHTDEGDTSATIEFEAHQQIIPEGKFRAEPLLATLRASDSIQMKWPEPCPFINNKTGLQGMIVGVRN